MTPETITTARSAGDTPDDDPYVGMITETRRSASPLDLLVGKRWVTTNGELDYSQSPDEDGADGAETTSYTYSYPGTGHSGTETRPDTSTSITTRYADGRIKSVTGTGVADSEYDYASHSEQGGGIVTTHTRLTSTGGTGEWTKTYSDLAGRTFRVQYPTEIHASAVKDHSSTSYYTHTAGAGSRGKPSSTMDPDGVTKSFTYSGEGNLWQVIETMPNSAGNRTTETLHDAVNDGTLGGCLRTITKLNTVTVSTSLKSGDGYDTHESSFGRVTKSSRTIASGGDWVETTTHPDNTRTVREYVDGRLDTLERRDNTTSPGVLISWESYGYDALGRMESAEDSRAGTTQFTSYTESGNLLTRIDPGGIVPADRTTTYEYDKMGRQIKIDAPNTAHNNITHTSYTVKGEVRAVWGDQTNPTFRVYDEQGRLVELHTWQTTPTLAHTTTTPPGGSALTSWTFHTQRGWLTYKEYPDGPDSGTARDPGPTYTYTAAGRIKTRTWGGGKRTRHDYRQGLLVAKRHFLTAGDDNGTNAGNDPQSPDVGQTYNNRGQLVNVITTYTSAHPGTWVLHAYNSTNFRVTRELQQIDPDLTFSLDSSSTGISIDHGSSIPDTISRYIHRKADSLLRDTGPDLRETKSATSTLYIGSTLAYDAEDGRLATVTGDFGGTTGTYTYAYQTDSNSDLIDKVTGPVHTVDNHWLGDRDALDWKENKVGTAIVSKYDYVVNNIGQRDSVAATSTVGTFGSTAPDWNWGYNARGEMVSSQHINTAASSRHYTFDAIGNRTEHREGTHTSSGGTAKSYTPNALNQYDAVGSLSPVYDLDGNMTSGPLPVAPTANSSLDWDGNNQIIEVTPSGGSAVKYHYDAFGRRVARTIGSDRTYWFYDGWNLIAEFSGEVHTTGDAPTPVLERTWLWGIDLSGTLQGAGGVGGLLAATLETGAEAGVYHPLFDGNGNIGQYINSSGTVIAKYEYDAFGNTLVSSGTHAALFIHRFSTKPLDIETGLYYYLYRWYDPLTGRWKSRDTIGEMGGVNLYGFVGNDGVNWFDFLGLDRLNVTIYPKPYKLEPPETPTPDDKNKNGFDDTEELIELAMKAMENQKSKLPNKGVNHRFIPVSSIEDANTGLSNCDCIETLNIEGHANIGYTIIGSVNDMKTRFYQNRIGFNPDVPSFKDQKYTYGFELFKNVKFCNPCSIRFLGCETGKGFIGMEFMKRVADATGCNVSASQTEMFPCNGFGEAHKDHPFGWSGNKRGANMRHAPPYRKGSHLDEYISL
jgi:RHS repeat-associated protein